MVMRLRLALHGHRNYKIYHLVAINQKARRDGKPAELLGIYDPHLPLGVSEKKVEWSVDRIRYWLSVGAQPSKAAEKLLILVFAVIQDNHSRPCSSCFRATFWNPSRSP